MSLEIYTPVQVAEKLGVDEEQVLLWRRQHGWPSFKIGRKVRFTEEHLQQIVAAHFTGKKSGAKSTGLAGQSPRSASRRRRSA